MSAASLIEALRNRFPEAEFYGVGGPMMVSAGLDMWYPLSVLSVMGITEVLRHLPRLLAFRSQLAERINALAPTAFIGIDAPDFNIGLAAKVRASGQPTVHVVSPSVWAWRRWRLKKITKAIDLMLPLFPFEETFYAEHGLSATCIGHPLADQLPLEPQSSREALASFLALPRYGVAAYVKPCPSDAFEQQWLAVLPGSRQGELKYIAPVFIQTMAVLARKRPNLHFLVPCANAQRAEQFWKLLPLPGEQPWVSRVHFAVGNSRLAMAAADAVLVASGTATLEAMLLKKPMVVAYRWHALTHAIISPLVKTPYVALPNLLAGRRLVPELIQEHCQVPALVHALELYLSSGLSRDSVVRPQREAFDDIHRSLRRDAANTAVTAIEQLCGLTSSRSAVSSGVAHYDVPILRSSVETALAEK
ncbi:MAG: lipid-A-disaccharide synthase [Gammaproteobacteria bacterium]